MSVGYSVTKQTLDDRLGGLAVQARDIIDAVNREAALVANLTTDQLTALGYSSDDVATLQGFGASGQTLRAAVYGQVANAQGSNLMFWLLKLVGIN